MATWYISLNLTVNDAGYVWAFGDIGEIDWSDDSVPVGVELTGETRRPGRVPTLGLRVTTPAAHLRWMLSRASGDGTARNVAEWVIQAAGEEYGRDADALRGELELLLGDVERNFAEREQEVVCI